MPTLPRRAPTWLVRTLAVTVVVQLGLGVFVATGARVADPVTTVEALSQYLGDPDFDGLPGWNRPRSSPRPVPGVYTYATEGFAKVSRLGIDRRYPAVTTRVVRHGPGCQWRETVPIFDEHRETYSACAQGGDQLDTGFGTRLVYFFVPASTDNVCSTAGTRTGAGMQPGETREFTCRDDDSDVTVTGSVTYRGTGSVDVAGVPVACRRVLVVTRLTGSNEGGAVRDLCTTPDTGLVLSEERSVGIKVRSAFIGALTYTEIATFRLQSLTPLV
jgi:hypothetical protein